MCGWWQFQSCKHRTGLCRQPGGTRSENWWGCATGHWKLDPKRSRQKWNLGPKGLILEGLVPKKIEMVPMSVENLSSHNLWLDLDLLSKDSQNLKVQVSIYCKVQNFMPKLLSIRNLEKKGKFWAIFSIQHGPAHAPNHQCSIKMHLFDKTL